MKHYFLKTIIAWVLCLSSLAASAQSDSLSGKLKGLDQYMAQILHDWNTPGACIGVVSKGKLVFAKGYGYRDFGKKLPVTPNTLYPIASNTKLFTTIAAGMLVEEGKLEWDKPIKTYVPSIKFYNNDLDNTITLHDMLSHRSGVSRHDMIWYKSDFSRKELFDKLKYLEPSQPLRQGFLYNNLMYAAAGYSIELLEKKSWETVVQDNIFSPLGMSRSMFSIADMKKDADHGVPYNEKRDTNILYEIPLYAETDGLGPAGSIISNVNDMSHWLIALMNNGYYNSKQVLPTSAVKASMEPSVALHNSNLDKGYTELQGPVYGMGRDIVSYRGHQLLYHGGDLPGFHSQISFMPQDSIGVIVFVIGDQSAPLYNIITYNVYERLLGMSLTPWSKRRLTEVIAGKLASKMGREKAGGGKVANTKPSHPLDDYVGQFGNDAYGNINISKTDSGLYFALHKISLPLNHYHYDRFDTPNDEEDGLYSLNFGTNPQGDVDRFVVSLDENEATFIRKPDDKLSDTAVLSKYTGKYKLGNTIFTIAIRNENELYIMIAGQPDFHLIPYKPRQFRIKEFADFTLEFVTDATGKTIAMKQKDPSGEYEIKRID